MHRGLRPHTTWLSQQRQRRSPMATEKHEQNITSRFGHKNPELQLDFLRLRSFGVIRIRISDPRSVWITVHQRDRRIHSDHGFTGPWVI